MDLKEIQRKISFGIGKNFAFMLHLLHVMESKL